MKVVDLHEAHFSHASDPLLGENESGIVSLHVSDHENDARILGGPRHLACLVDRGARGLFDEHVLARPDCRQRGRDVVAGGADDHSIDAARHKIVIVREPPGGGNVEVVADFAQEILRDVADSSDLEPVVKLAQMRQVLNLGYRPASDHADFESIQARSFTAFGTVGCGTISQPVY